MNIRFRRTDTVLLLCALASLLAFFMLGTDQFPEMGYQNGDSSKQVYAKGLRLMQSLGYELEDWPSFQVLKHDKATSSYLYETLSCAEAVEACRDSVPVFQWRIIWYQRKDSASSGMSIHLGEDPTAVSLDNVDGGYQLDLDAAGRPLAFEYVDSLETFATRLPIDDDLALRKATRLSRRLLREDADNWIYDGVHERGSDWGPIRQYNWYRDRSVLGIRSSLSVTLRHGKIIGFHRSHTLPKSYESQQRRYFALVVAGAFLVALIFILGIVQLVKRLRGDLLDLKMSWLPTSFFLLGWLIQLFNEPVININLIIQLSISTLMFVGMMWALFALGESLTRQTWSDKLITFDAVRRKMLYPQTGLNLFRGLTMALTMLGVYTMLTRLAIRFGDASLALHEKGLVFLSSRLGFLHLTGSSVFMSMLVVVLFCLFIMSLLKSWVKKGWLAFFITWVIWLLMNVGLPLPNLSHDMLHLVLHGVLGLLLLWTFFSFDWLTALTAYFSLPLFYYGLTALYLRSNGFWLQGVVLLGFLGALLAYAIRAYQSETSEEDITAFVPDYMQRIYERERIQRELEIARHVQLTFLPRNNPDIPSLDIATLCLPAKEVGGDYYDFVISDKKLGIVIGDVSGKGISAAFYMTLTKGFLKAQTKILSSPREVLIHINELFYENAERGMFISMILAFFDLEKQTLTFARAGHNPLILRRSDRNTAEEVGVAGIALGLERGEVFKRTIEEKEISFSPGDEFLFYTDGLNEAQNVKKDEFGEERLMHLVETYHALPAEIQLAKIRQEIETFSKGTPQHDDMTAVLVKIKASN